MSRGLLRLKGSGRNSSCRREIILFSFYTNYQYRDFSQGERIVSKVLPQLNVTVDKGLFPPAVTWLMAQE